MRVVKINRIFFFILICILSSFLLTSCDWLRSCQTTVPKLKNYKTEELILYFKNSKLDTTRLIKKFAEKLNLNQKQVTLKRCDCDPKLVTVIAKGITELVDKGSGNKNKTDGAGNKNTTGGAGNKNTTGGAGNKNTTSGAGNELETILGSDLSNGIELYQYNMIVTTDFRENINNNKLGTIPATENRTAPKIAIIDSGIDKEFESISSSFDSNSWNFINNNNDIFTNSNEHGSDVAELLVNELIIMKTPIQKLLILKVLDKENRGSLFDMICAIVYAYKNGADILNLSMGYYGEESPLLKQVLSAKFLVNVNDSLKNKFSRKWIIVAAGNEDKEADNIIFEQTPELRNLDSRRFKFFPAFYSASLPNIITVTTVVGDSLANIRVSNDQNYSLSAVDIGVLANDFRGNFIHNKFYYKGSSFATPIFTGILANEFSKGAFSADKGTLFLNKLTNPTVKVDANLATKLRGGRFCPRIVNNF